MSKKLIITIILILIIIGITITFGLLTGKKNQNKLSNETSKESEDYLENNNGTKRIKLSFNNEEVYVKLQESEASKDLINMLPLTLEFEDFNNTEKIAYLPSELSSSNSPSGYTPHAGDFAYYAPWGNLSIFCQDFKYSNSLIKLGEFDSGIEKLQNINENFKITIEIVE